MSTLFSKLSSKVELYYLKFIFDFRSLFDFIRTAFRYYSHPIYRKVDISLIKSYAFKNPYLISQNFHEGRKEENIYVYGETLIAGLETIVRECELTQLDVFYELGCGRGRTCFWLAFFLKARVIGIEFIPDFIEKANQINTQYHLNNPTFYCQDFLTSDFQDATVIYLTGTCLEEAVIRQLMLRLDEVSSGCKLISVSFPITEYTPQAHWQLIKTFSASFSWGFANVYLQIRSP